MNSIEELWGVWSDMETTMLKLGFNLYESSYTEMYMYIQEYGSLKVA